MERKFLNLFCVLLIVACQQRSASDGDTMPPLYATPKKVALNIEEGFRINPFTGDSIKHIYNYYTDTIMTGVPLRIKGKVVSTDSLEPPQQFKIPATIDSNFYTNKRTLSPNPAQTFIDDSVLQEFNPEIDTCNCPLVATYGDTIPVATPVEIDVKHEQWEVPVVSTALPPRARDNVRYNIKYLD